MKRLFSALLAGMLALSLAACGGEPLPAEKTEPPASMAERTPEPEPTPPSSRQASAPEPESAPGPGPSASEGASSVSAGPGALSPSGSSAPAAALPDGFNFTVDPDNPEGFVSGGVREIDETVYRYSDQVAAGGDWQTPGYLRDLSPVRDDEIGERLSDIDVLTVDLEDDTRYTYTFHTGGLEVTKSPPGANPGEPVRYRVDPEAYAKLLEAERARLSEGMWFSSWLDVIRKSRITEIAFRSSDGVSETAYTPDAPIFDSAYHGLHISIEPGSVERVGAETRLTKAARIDISFATGIFYRVEVNAAALLIVASDMDYALRYPLKHEETTVQELDGIAQGKVVPLTAKPVVYLYPEQPVDVSVKVRYRGEFSTTIPAYRDGWEVTAYPDGTIVDKTDGKAYPYLFWDGNEPVDWDFSEGFCIAGPDTERFLREKLAYLGLDAREMEEFIEYWLPEMQQNAYNLITFSTEQYERLAPMEISPAPDSLLRVHMVYRGLDAPRPIREQKLRGGFERKGFAAVEWGGSRA